MQSRRAAEGEQRKTPRVDSAADRNEPYPLGHRRVDDPMNAARSANPIDAELDGDGVDRRLGRQAVEPAAPAEKAFRIEIAKHQIGVGHGRRAAAVTVTGGTRNRPDALRADMQDPAGIDPRDRSAAGTNTGDVEAVERDRLAGDPAGSRQARPAIDDQRDVGARPAHVERDQVALVYQPRGIDAAGDTARRSREHGTGGEPARLVDRSNPAMRLDDQSRPGVAGLHEAPFELLKIARQGRADIGVDDRRRNPLELLDLRQHRRRQRDINSGQRLAQDFRRLPLMRRIAPGVEIADRDRLDLGLA